MDGRTDERTDSLLELAGFYPAAKKLGLAWLAFVEKKSAWLAKSRFRLITRKYLYFYARQFPQYNFFLSGNLVAEF